MDKDKTFSSSHPTAHDPSTPTRATLGREEPGIMAQTVEYVLDNHVHLVGPKCQEMHLESEMSTRPVFSLALIWGQASDNPVRSYMVVLLR